VRGRTISELALGDFVELTRVAAPDNVAAFLGAIGDDNPVHSDPDFAATTSFERPIAPGMWTAGLLSAAIGTQLPGPGSIYIKQDLKFLRPVYFGDTITAHVEIIEMIPERNRVRLSTTCANSDGEAVLAGEAWVLPPLRAVIYDEPQPRESTPFRVLAPVAWASRAAAMWYAAVADGLDFWTGPRSPGPGEKTSGHELIGHTTTTTTI
jgi:3-hydroxybutyryl-CoA dehydratase